DQGNGYTNDDTHVSCDYTRTSGSILCKPALPARPLKYTALVKNTGYRPRTNQITRTWVIGENGDNYTMSQWSGTIVLEKMVSPSLGECQIANGMRSKGHSLTNDFRNCYCKCSR